MIQSLPFEKVLSAAVTPLVLISGVGLILLSLVNRYSHALDRTRQLHNTPSDNQELFIRRQKQVSHMYHRCSILKKSIGYLVMSVACSGIIILLSVVQLVSGANLDFLKTALLFIGILTLVISILLFFVDIRLSMTALDIELGKKP
jgi:hypothetical protein